MDKSERMKAYWASKTPEERQAHARMMARAYWDRTDEGARKAHMERARAGRKAKQTAS